MRQELFRKMYDEIRLDREQKNRIWSNLNRENGREYTGAGKRFHTPAFASICVCIILLIGVPVLAANSSLIQSLTGAFSVLGGTELNLTEEQKEIYAKYGSELKNEIPLNNGILKLEAIISDGHDVCIPFSMKIEKGTFSDVVFDGIKEGKFLSVILTQIEDLSFSFKDSYETIGGRYTMLDRKQSKDGVITGCYLLVLNSDRGMKQGDVLQITSRKEFEEKARGTGKTDKEIMSLIPVVGEVTLPAIAESQSIPVASIQEELLIDKMQLSPFSLTIEGADYVSNEDKLSNCEFALELKDGSTVEMASTGRGGSAKVWDNYFYIYTDVVLFEEPVNLDDVAGVRIWNDYTSFDLWIPAGGIPVEGIPVGDGKEGK